MITDEQIELSLSILNGSAEAEALYRKMRAEQRADALKARAFLIAKGPVEERKAKSLLDPEYQLAMKAVAQATENHRKTQNDREGSRYIIEVWENEGHNARASERVR